MLLNNQQITEEIKKEIKMCIETNDSEMKQMIIKYLLQGILPTHVLNSGLHIAGRFFTR